MTPVDQYDRQPEECPDVVMQSLEKERIGKEFSFGLAEVLLLLFIQGLFVEIWMKRWLLSRMLLSSLLVK